MKTFEEFITEAEDKGSLATFIATNLYRLGSRKDANVSAMLLMVAAAVLSDSDDPRSLASARRLAQLAMSKRGK